jgi:hypothetical protein
MKNIIPFLFLFTACNKTAPISPIITSTTTLTAPVVIDPVYKFQGFNFALWNKDFRKSTPSYKSDFITMFHYMKTLNSNTIIIDWPVNFNDDGTLIPYSKAIATPSFSDISEVAKLGKDSGFFVILKPHSTLVNSTDNRNIWNTDSTKFNPKFLKEWNNYLRLMLDSVNNVDGVCIGTELNHVDNVRRDEWISLIKDIKTIFKGQLTYDGLFSRWLSVPTISDVVFWDQVDYISASLYIPVAKNDNASVNNIIYGWYNQNDYQGNKLGDITNVIDYLRALSIKYKKQIYAMESGYQSANTGLYDVNNSPNNTKTINNDLQARGFSGYFNVTSNNLDLFAGISIWGMWTGTIQQKNINDIWYTMEFSPYNKPASDTIKKYFTR